MSTSVESVTMPRQSVRILSELLSVPGTHKKTKDLYKAGRICAQIESIGEDDEKFPSVADSRNPTDAEMAAVKAWRNAPISLNLSTRDLELCRKTLDEVAGKGTLPASPHLVSLMEAIGVDED